MILIITLGLLVTLICLGLQALTLALAAHYSTLRAEHFLAQSRRRAIFARVTIHMTVLMVGLIAQIALWALIYRVLGALPDFETALYFSGVTFTTLGYGDVLITGRIRMLAALEACCGVMMFGITTAGFVAVIQRATGKGEEGPRNA